MGEPVPFGFPAQSPPEDPPIGLKETNVDGALTDQAGSLCFERRLGTVHFISYIGPCVGNGDVVEGSEKQADSVQ